MTAHSKSCGRRKGRVVRDHLLRTRTGSWEPCSILLLYQHLIGGWDGVQCNEFPQNVLEGEGTRAGNPSCTGGEWECCGSGGAELSPCCSPQSWVRWVWFCQPREMQLLLEIKTEAGRGWVGPLNHHQLWSRTVPGSIFPSTVLDLILNTPLTMIFSAASRTFGSLGPLVQLEIQHSRPLEKHQSKGDLTDSWCGFSLTPPERLQEKQ